MVASLLVELLRRDNDDDDKSNRFTENPYIYTPNKIIGVIGALLMVSAHLILFIQFLKNRSWFLWTLLIGLCMESLGYVVRIKSIHDVYSVFPFAIQFLLILLAPSFLAAACYAAFGRLVWFASPAHALNFKTLWVPPRFIAPIFILFDLISFFIQLLGAVYMTASMATASDDRTPEEQAKDVENSKRGTTIVTVGLAAQLACFGIFAIIGLRFIIVSRNWSSDHIDPSYRGWRKLNWALNIAALLITLRAFYRIFEIPEKPSKVTIYLQSHEWAFWLLDTLPIFITLLCFIFFHPGRLLPRRYNKLLLRHKPLIQEKEGKPFSGRPTSDREGQPFVEYGGPYNQPYNDTYNNQPAPYDQRFYPGVEMNNVNQARQ